MRNELRPRDPQKTHCPRLHIWPTDSIIRSPLLPHLHLDGIETRRRVGIWGKLSQNDERRLAGEKLE